MTTNSPTIDLSNVNVELSYAYSATISLNDSAVRTLAGAGGSGTTISMDMLRGKSSVKKMTISTNQKELNLRTWAINNGWDGKLACEITIGTGVYIWSDNTSTPGLTINGSWPAGLTLINNGYIIGKGGAGGVATFWTYNASGSAGGPALSLGVSLSIDNANGYIAGGGGGGFTINSGFSPGAGGGGGAGGGNGGYSTGNGERAPSSTNGGAPGNPGGAGVILTNSSGYESASVQGGGGGRQLPGSGGSAITATGVYNSSGQNYFAKAVGAGGGAGGSGGATYMGNYPGSGTSGAGGAGNNPGGSAVGQCGTGGGGWGAAGGGGASKGGAGGAAILYNGYSIAWVQNRTGNLYGSH